MIILTLITLLSTTLSFGNTVDDEELFSLLRTCKVGTYQNRNKTVEVVGTMEEKCKVIFGNNISCLIGDDLKNIMADPHKKLNLLEKSTVLGKVFSACNLSFKQKTQPKKLLPFCDDSGRDTGPCRIKYVPGQSLNERRKVAKKNFKSMSLSQLEKEQQSLRKKCFDGSDTDSCILFNEFKKALGERRKK